MGAIEPKALGFQRTNRCFRVAVIVERHPFLAALGCAVEGAWSSLEAHHMGLECPHGVTAAQNRRQVVGFFHVLEEHREIGHAAIEHGLEAFKAAREQRHELRFACRPSVGGLAAWLEPVTKITAAHARDQGVCRWITGG